MKRQAGQAMILAVLGLGTIMAGIVIFGAKRQEDVSVTAGRLEGNYDAFEAMSFVARRIQHIYVDEAGCDPDALDTRLSSMAALPAAPTSISGASATAAYVPAQPSVASPGKENRCTGGTGCRQFAVPLSNWVYIVTAGAVSRTADPRTGDCPRDGSVHLSVAVNGSIFHQNVTLMNVCSLASCDGGQGLSGLSITLGAGNMATSACTGTNNNVPSRKYGGGFTESSAQTLSTNDLRWARRFLETGGADVGDTSMLYVTTPVTTGNGACTVAQSASQCKAVPCFPALDVNRDGMNTEVDLAILEKYMRGFLTGIPVNELP